MCRSISPLAMFAIALIPALTSCTSRFTESDRSEYPQDNTRAEASATESQSVYPSIPVETVPSSATRSRATYRQVAALTKTADSLRRNGQLHEASASLERALRIEPRNPEIWYGLALVRFEQGKAHQAEQLAFKSIALAGPDDSVRRRNWQLIARIREQSGNLKGAREAQRRARYVGRDRSL